MWVEGLGRRYYFYSEFPGHRTAAAVKIRTAKLRQQSYIILILVRYIYYTVIETVVVCEHNKSRDKLHAREKETF